MAAKLVIEEGDLKGLSLSLEEGDTWIIGRDPDECQLVIEDPLVSRKHLMIRRLPQGLIVENLSVTHPTLLNDEEMENQVHPLQNGDTLKVGNETLRFYEDSSAHILDEDLSSGLDEEADAEINAPISPENKTPKAPPPNEEAAPVQDTVLGDEDEDLGSLAEIDFGVVEAGRWLLKVIGGPNSGAEFYMQTGNSYIVGTDPQSCDIIFHDTSVSRQHARITVTSEDVLFIEDLKSRNGVLINGALIEDKQTLNPSTIVTLGTTSFVIYDREGEMQTIISPLLPSIVKVLQQEPVKTEAAAPARPTQPEPVLTPVEAPTPQPAETTPPLRPSRQIGPYIVLTAIIGLFVIAGIGTTTLFREEPVIMQTQENANEIIQQALNPFPAIRWTFNPSNGTLLLLGHVSTLAEKNQLLYNLGNLKFIKNIDHNGIIIDEGVWAEVNSLLANNPEWQGITIYSPSAGQFILSGELKTRKQAEQLSSYLSLNFPYLDLLNKQIVVDEDVVNQIRVWLQQAQLPDIEAQMANGEINLNGVVPPDRIPVLNEIIGKIKQIPGVRIVSNHVHTQTPETGILDISDHYQVTGESHIGNKITVVINGRILSEGDDLDGMEITKITPEHVYLEKDGDRFRIDY